jgi:hypothetical protein
MSEKSGALRDIVAGAVILAIGLFMGGSVFTGDADLLDWIFDLLGIFWLGRGIYRWSTE